MLRCANFRPGVRSRSLAKCRCRMLRSEGSRVSLQLQQGPTDNPCRLLWHLQCPCLGHKIDSQTKTHINLQHYSPNSNTSPSNVQGNVCPPLQPQSAYPTSHSQNNPRKLLQSLSSAVCVSLNHVPDARHLLQGKLRVYHAASLVIRSLIISLIKIDALVSIFLWSASLSLYPSIQPLSSPQHGRDDNLSLRQV